MTVSEMLTLLGYRLDDPNEDRYIGTVKLAALNAHQDTVVDLVSAGMLPGLQRHIDFDCPSTGYALPLSGLSPYLRYISSFQYQAAFRGWITKVDVDDLGELQDNQYTKGTDKNPICYVWSNYYYLLVDTYGGTYSHVRLFYLMQPSVMLVSAQSKLPSSLHEPLTRLAESDLRMTYKHGTLEEAITMRNEALKSIMTINEQYKQGLIA